MFGIYIYMLELDIKQVDAAVGPPVPSVVPPVVSPANDPIVPVGSECSLYLHGRSPCNKKNAGKKCRKYFFKGEDGEFYRCRFHKGGDEDGQCGEIGKGGLFSKKKKCHEDEKDKNEQEKKRNHLTKLMNIEKKKQVVKETQRKRKADERKELSDKCDFFGKFSGVDIFKGDISYMKSAEAYRECLAEEEFDKDWRKVQGMSGHEEKYLENRAEGTGGGLPLNFKKFKKYFEKNVLFQDSHGDWNAFKMKAKRDIEEESKREKEQKNKEMKERQEKEKEKKKRREFVARHVIMPNGSSLMKERMNQVGYTNGGRKKKHKRKTKKKKYKRNTKKKKLRKKVRKGGRKSVRKGGRKSVRK